MPVHLPFRRTSRELIADAWTLASIDFGVTKIRSGHLLLALLENDDLARLARESSAEFQRISVEELHKHLPDLVAGSEEDKLEAQSAASQAERPSTPGAPGGSPRRRPSISTPST